MSEIFTQSEMLNLLDNSSDYPIMPICIPSYKRWLKKDNKTINYIISVLPDDMKKNTYVFVRKEQEDLYKESFSDIGLNIVPLPHVNGLAGTRQYIQDFVVHDLKEPYFIDMDDDVTSLRYVYYNEELKRDANSVKANNVSYDKILKLSIQLARYAFEEKNCVFGNCHRSHWSAKWPASQDALHINRGPSPRQLTLVNGKKLDDLGVKRNLEFDETGDDVGFIAEIAQRELDFFQIPSLVYAFVDDAVNSVIRNDDNRHRLAAQEYELLKKYPMGREYLKITIKFEDGSYKFSDIDFTKYRKLTSKPLDDVKYRTLIDNGYLKH